MYIVNHQRSGGPIIVLRPARTRHAADVTGKERDDLLNFQPHVIRATVRHYQLTRRKALNVQTENVEGCSATAQVNEAAIVIPDNEDILRLTNIVRQECPDPISWRCDDGGLLASELLYFTTVGQ